MQPKKLRLPPVDIYRAPFVEPIGHLAMQAARTEQLIISLLGAIPFDGFDQQMSHGAVEPKTRDLQSDSAFILERLSLIDNADLRKQVGEAIDQFKRLKEFRNRVIHDAVEVGISMEGKAFALAVAYQREKRNPSVVHLHPVEAHQIAELACEFYELNQDIDALLYRIRHQETPE